MFEVTDAKREMLVGAVGYVGASGAGKTLSMLKTAFGFMKKKYPNLSDSEVWQKIGVIDTEHSRSKIYAETSSFGIEIGSFKHLNFEKPFSVERLDAAIAFLKEKHGVEIIIIDSVSHFWEGEGGILDLQQKFGGSFQAWRDVNPTYEHFISLVTGEKYNIDTLNGMRAKQHYEVTENEVGKLKIQKMGLKPIQRDSLEYEFHIVFNIDMDHHAIALKDNSGMFSSGQPQVIEAEVGEKLYDWLKTGVDANAEKLAKEKAEKEEKEAMIRTAKAYAKSPVEGMQKFVFNMIEATVKKVGDLRNLSVDQLKRMVEKIHDEEQKLKKEQEETMNEIGEELENHQAVQVHTAKEDEYYYHPNSETYFKLSKGKTIEITPDFTACTPASKEAYLKFKEADAEELDNKVVADLKEVAKSFNIKGYSSMKKDELIAAIKKAQVELESQPKVESPL